MTPTRAQEVATLTGEPLLRSAIVRQYIDNTNIHYCSDINGNHYFVLYQHANPTNAIVANFPSNLEVHDFEVFEKNVYFCGTSPNGGNPYGMVGQISIYDLFYNNGPYNIGILQNSYLDTLPLASHLASCDRMDVFKRGGHVHLAIVGELELGSTYGGTLRRTACDIWFNGTDWTGSMLYQKNDLYKTSDITCTEQAVVVSAYDNDSSYVLLLAFNKVAGFPSYPISPLSIKLQDQRADNNILIERLSGDDVALAHYFHDTVTQDYGVAIHHIPNVTTIPSLPSHFSLHYIHGRTTPRFPLMDLRYNSKDFSLMLLHDIVAPLWTNPRSTLLDFDASNLPSLSARAWHYYDNISLLTLDNRVEKYTFSLGGNYNPLSEPLLSMKNKNTEGCYQSTTFSYLDVTPYVLFSIGPFDNSILKINQKGVLDYPNPDNHTVSVICEQ